MDVDRVTYVTYADEAELRRSAEAAHVITVQEPQRQSVPPSQAQQQHQPHRYSPHDQQQIQQQQQQRYQGSPNTSSEGYEPAQQQAPMHLSSPHQHVQTYSPPLDAIRTSQHQQQQPQQHQQHLVTTYTAADGTIKYSAEVSVATAESLKPSNTYTTLETVPLAAPAQAIPYTQYITAAEAYQQAPASYSYAKPQEIFIYPASSQPSREVRIDTEKNIDLATIDF